MTLALLLLACADPTGTLNLGDKGDTGSPTADDTGAPSDDTGDTQDTEPQGNAAAGDYAGWVSWEVPEWDWVICDWDLDLEIDEDGNLSGDEVCVYVSDDGQEYDLPIEVDGVVSDDGEVTGAITYDSWIYGRRAWEVVTFESELRGDAVDGRLVLEFDDVGEFGNYGDLDMLGWLEAERE